MYVVRSITKLCLLSQVRLQTQDPAKPLYRGTWHCFSATLKQESVNMLNILSSFNIVFVCLFVCHINLTRFNVNVHAKRCL